MAVNERKALRCAVYTRKSSEHGLEQDFNSLDAQREAAEAYIKSQAHEGWRMVKARYDDGGISGGTLERPALQSLLDDIRSRKVDVVGSTRSTAPGRDNQSRDSRRSSAKVQAALSTTR